MTYEDLYKACLHAAHEMGSDIKKMSWFSRSGKSKKAAAPSSSEVPARKAA